MLAARLQLVILCLSVVTGRQWLDAVGSLRLTQVIIMSTIGARRKRGLGIASIDAITGRVASFGDVIGSSAISTCLLLSQPRIVALVAQDGAYSIYMRSR